MFGKKCDVWIAKEMRFSRDGWVPSAVETIYHGKASYTAVAFIVMYAENVTVLTAPSISAGWLGPRDVAPALLLCADDVCALLPYGGAREGRTAPPYQSVMLVRRLHFLAR